MMNSKDTLKPLSVLIVAPDPRVPGGVSTFVETMKPCLQNCDVTSFYVGKLRERDENIFQIFMRVVVAPIRIALLAKRRNFDVVYINPSLSENCLVREGLILFALYAIGYHRILTYIHGWDFRTQEAIQRHAIWRWLFKKTLNGTARIMVLGSIFQRSLESMGIDRDRVIVTRTMFDSTYLKQAENKPATQRRTVLYMSRFELKKGVYELLDAFARIAPDFPDVDLVFAGSGEETGKMQSRAVTLGIKDRVKFPGYLGGKAKAESLKSCSVYALPTYFEEGMPVAILEAMGAGKPLITTRIGGLADVMSEENGVILDSVTAATVEAGLRKLLRDADYCREVGERNYTYAWQRFEAHVVTAEIEAVLRDIAAVKD